MNNMSYKEIKKCRICGNKNLLPILDLGIQHLTGVFPKTKDEKITSGPLSLVKCSEERHQNSCGLLQSKYSYNSKEMYGYNYGYQSNLNKSMVTHLTKIVSDILNLIKISYGDVIVDIGSNDGTLLKVYPKNGTNLVGIDPTGKKFKKYYPKYIELISDFFSEKSFRSQFGEKKAKVVTSIAMFYDLENPIDFATQVHKILDDEGIWVLEQSYMPTMIENLAYDTVCHEHLEYYRLKQIKWIMDKASFKIIDVKFNDTNGGSFLITVAKQISSFQENLSLLNLILNTEKHKQFNLLKPYNDFKIKTLEHKLKLQQFISKIKSDGKTVLGYGASTKGNVLLQFCRFTEKDIPFIAEVNKDKFGCYTPGTHIPIISEKEARAMKPDYFLVLPWHFKENIVSREKNYLKSNGKLIFPLPEIKVILK